MRDAVLIAAAILLDGARTRHGNTSFFPDEPDPTLDSAVEDAIKLDDLIADYPEREDAQTDGNAAGSATAGAPGPQLHHDGQGNAQGSAGDDRKASDTPEHHG